MEMIPLPLLGFLRRVFPANNLASNDNLTRTTKRQNTQQRKTNNKMRSSRNNQQHNKSMLRYDRQLARFSRLVRHPARKWSGSILTTPEPARGNCYTNAG